MRTQRRRGDRARRQLLSPRRRSSTLRARIRSRVVDVDGHWEIPGPPNHYATMRVDGRNVGVHRASFAAFVGPIPPGAMILHDCDRRRCVRPGCLHPGDAKMNAREAAARGLLARGSRNGRARLSEADVRAVREAAPGTTMTALAARYGVTRSAISLVVRGLTWAWLP